MKPADWDAFRDKYPEEAQEIKNLGSELYESGAEQASTDQRLDKLAGVMRSLPKEVLSRFGLAPSFTSNQLLTTVFELGRDMLLNLERSGR